MSADRATASKKRGEGMPVSKESADTARWLITRHGEIVTSPEDAIAAKVAGEFVEVYVLALALDTAMEAGIEQAAKALDEESAAHTLLVPLYARKNTELAARHEILASTFAEMASRLRRRIEIRIGET